MAKKEIVKDAEVIEEKAPKKEKDFKLRKTLKLAWDIFFWAVFICIAALWITDYVNTLNEKDPVFCISKSTTTVEKSTVNECVGVGYKVYTYETQDQKTVREFGGFWIEPHI